MFTAQVGEHGIRSPGIGKNCLENDLPMSLPTSARRWWQKTRASSRKSWPLPSEPCELSGPPGFLPHFPFRFP